MAIREDLGPSAPGKSEPLSELFQRYQRPVVYFFLNRGFSQEESRDLAQETFLRVFKNIDRFRGESSLATWVFQIATNLYRNTLRSQSTLKRDACEVSLVMETGQLLTDEWEPVWGEKDGGPLEAALLEERAKLLRKALDELPPQMRQAVILRVDADMKYREIAEVMHVSIETVKAHLYQARQHLRDRLADYFTKTEL